MQFQYSFELSTCEADVMRECEFGGVAALNGPRVFIVDDDEAVRLALSMLVESFGWVSLAYASAEEFLENYSAGERDCLVLDLQMPGMPGAELLDILARNGTPIPVLVVSAFAEDGQAQRAIQAGARAALQKPFSDDALLREIRNVLKIPVQ